MTEQTRKEKIRAYKETPKQMGVYRIVNTTNGKSLIGAARDLRARMNRQQGKLCTSCAIALPSEIATDKAPARRQYSSYDERRQHRVRSERAVRRDFKRRPVGLGRNGAASLWHTLAIRKGMAGGVLREAAPFRSQHLSVRAANA